MDLINVTISGKEDDMNKSLKNFVTRMAIAVVFILAPILIKIIISVSGVSSQYQSINDGVKTIFCILG